VHPAISRIEPIVVRKQDDEVSPASFTELRELSQKQAGKSLRALAFVDTKVDDPQDAHNVIAHSEHTKLDAHLGDDLPADRRHIAEVWRNLEVGTRRIG
jgi:hypothetical protein